MADEDVSRYKILQAPEFTPNIPPHLVNKLDEKEKYLVETLFRIEQQNAWLIKQACEASERTADLDVRAIKLENWKKAIMSKWSVLVGIFVLVLPVVLKILADKIWPSK